MAVPFTPAGQEHPHTQLWGFRLAWPPLWMVSCPCCHCAEGLGGARLPSSLICASPSLTQHPCHHLGLGPGLVWELGPGESPLLRLIPLTLVCLFVCSVRYLPTGLLCLWRLGDPELPQLPPALHPLLLLAVSELCPAGSPCLGCPCLCMPGRGWWVVGIVCVGGGHNDIPPPPQWVP